MEPEFGALLSYTEWERRQWRDELRGREDTRALLGVSVGPHNDGRFETVATLLRLSGARFGFRDFLASAALGGELRPDGT